MIAGVAVIHLVDPETVPLDLARACLSDEERSRADRFRLQLDADHWIACRASLRKILGNAIQLPPHAVPLIYSEFGKPALARPYQFLHFNLSHCSSLAAIILSIDGPVGIDLEATERATDLIECESTFCHPAEILNLPTEKTQRSLQLLRIWTAKEAALKALGTGLSFPPERSQIFFGENEATFFSEEPNLIDENQTLIELSIPRLSKHQSFVSICRSILKIQIINGDLDYLKNLTIDVH